MNTTQDQTIHTEKTELKINMGIALLMGKKFYDQNPMTIFIRETLQHSLDAQSTKIEIDANPDYDPEGNPILKITVKDNGTGIDDIQKYFLTVGEPGKKNAENSIGGFGLAKLAIISMDNWSLTSLDGTITRDILLNSLPIDPQTSTGCILSAETKSFNKYNWQPELTTILRLTSTPPRTEIIFNGETIEKVQLKKYTLPSGKQIAMVSESESNKNLYTSNQMIIRLNGLPQFYRNVYAEDQSSNYIYDIRTNLTPYDDNYPLTATREATNQPYTNEINSIINEIAGMSRDKQKAEKEVLIHRRIINDNTCLAGTATLKDLKKYAWYIKTYTRYIHQIAELMGENPHQFKTGLAMGIEASILAGMNHGNEFYINPTMYSHGDKAGLLELSMHEFTHYYQSAHYDSYALKYGEIATKVLTGIFNKTFRQ